MNELNQTNTTVEEWQHSTEETPFDGQAPAQETDTLQKQRQEIDCMSEEEIVQKSMKRISADTEKLTRRNMKECVAEYIQTLCMEDIEFAKMTINPRKSMVHCFQYITRKAWDYVQDEMKANGIKPGTGQQGYGSDIPDGLCYQWAEDYFRDPNAKEDEEKSAPNPNTGKGNNKPSASIKSDKKEKKTPEKDKKTEEAQITGQLSLMDLVSQGDSEKQEGKNDCV